MAVPDLYPTFSDAEFARRYGAVRAKMAEHRVDALLLYGAGRAADVQYLANWPGTRESYLLFPLEGEPVLLVQLANHVPNARRTAVTPDVRWAGPSSADGVADAVAERGLARRRIGLVGAVPWRAYLGLRERLGQVELVDLSDALRDLRMVKSPEELARLRIAARFTDQAMHALEREVRPGLREHELAAIVEGAYAREGGTHGIHFMATPPMRDPAIGVPSQIPSSRVIERGDVLITEISAEYWGYTGQIHRAYAIGAEPTDAYRSLHDVAVGAYESVRDVLHDGATVAEVLDAAEVVHAHGFTIYDDLLHGASQLPPLIQTRRTARYPQPEGFVFREDMVVVIQPNVVNDDSGRMGLQVGETVRITKTGTERLHEFPMRFVVCGS